VLFGLAVVAESMGSFRWLVLLPAALDLPLLPILPVFRVLGDIGLRAGEKLFR